MNRIGDWRAGADVLCCFEKEADILEADLHRAGAAEDALEDEVGHHALRKEIGTTALVDDAKRGFHVDAAFHAHRQRFAGGEQAGVSDRVAHDLANLPHAGFFAEIKQATGIGVEQRLHTFKGVARTGGQHAECSRRERGHRADHGRINQCDAVLCQACLDFACRFRANGRRLDINFHLLAGHDAVRPQRNGLADIDGRQAGESDLAFVEDLPVRCGGGTALAHRKREVFRIGVVRKNLNSSLDHAGRDRPAHRTDTNEANIFFHVFSSELAGSHESIHVTDWQ